GFSTQISNMADDRSSQLIIVFIVFFLLLNYPLLSIVDRSDLWFGMPVQFFYMFFIWLALIVVVGLVVRNRKK
ncbi:MAG: hypothetical protein WCR52_23050, partial [Bacteroidota bacterium]